MPTGAPGGLRAERDRSVRDRQSEDDQHLLATSARLGLAEPLTGILIERDNQDLPRSVAKNDSAPLSPAGRRQPVKWGSTTTSSAPD
jgi:hypothetical protein